MKKRIPEWDMEWHGMYPHDDAIISERVDFTVKRIVLIGRSAKEVMKDIARIAASVSGLPMSSILEAMQGKYDASTGGHANLVQVSRRTLMAAHTVRIKEK
jgi:hypothetical protein